VRVSRPLGGCLLALALATQGACSSPEERFAEHLSRAETFLAEDRPDDALIELQGALKIDPDSAEVNWRLGELLRDKSAYRAAIFHFGEVYRIDPTRVDAAMEQASLLWFSSPARAERLIRDAQQRFPDEPRVYRAESGLAVVKHDTARALAAALRAIELDPNDMHNWIQLGAVHMSRIREYQLRDEQAPDEIYQDAIDAFQKVDDLEGGHVGARVEQARIYASWKDHWKQTAASFRSGIALAKERGNPEHRALVAQAMEEWARIARRDQLRHEALIELVDAQPERVAAWEQLARSTSAIEGKERGEEVYQQMLAALPDAPQAHLVYTNHLSRTDRNAEAIAHLQSVLPESIDDPLLWEQLVRLHILETQLPEARAAYAEMVDAHEDEPVTRRTEARLALVDDRPEDAVRILREFAGDETTETERLRAVAEMRVGNLAEAAAAVDRAISLAPAYPPGVVRIKALIHAEAKEWRQVLRTLRELEQRGHHLAARDQLLRAQALYEIGEAESGRKVLEQILARRIIAPGAALEYARREGRDHPAEAREYLTVAMRYIPNNYDLLEAMTRLDLREGRGAEALKRLDRVIEDRVAGPRILLLRAELLASAGQLERAEADALRAFEASPELPGAVDLLFAIYEAQGKLDEARRSFEEAESVGVLHGGARVLLGRLYAMDGDADKARAMYEKVIAENPEIAAAKNDLAFLLATRDEDLDRALALAEEAQRALPDNPSVADTVGYVYFRTGRYEAALQQLRFALELSKESLGDAAPAYHYHLGLTLSALDRGAEAAAAFETALALDPGFPGAEDARRQLEAARGDAPRKPSSS
jgi:tetratricopeptide (TPR) repeat protein